MLACGTAGIDDSVTDGSNSDSTETGVATTTGDGDMSCDGELGCACALNETCVDDLMCSEGTCVSSTCGDGVISAGESCDDANVTNSDGCNADCQPTEVVEISAGGYHTCALFNSGEARCWGRGNYGQLGQGNTNLIGDSETPASALAIVLAAPIISIRAGDQHTCALLDTGGVACWGLAALGRLGYANTSNIGDDELPVVAGTVQLGEVAIAIDAGDTYTCALLNTGYPICWGSGGYHLGQEDTNNHLGDDEHPGSAAVIDVGSTSSMIVAGSSSACALRDDDELICWGNNSYGELGLVSLSNQIPISQAIGMPAQIPKPPLMLDFGSQHACAIFKDTNHLSCWGHHASGRLGYPGQAEDIGDNEQPGNSVVLGGTPIAVATGDAHSCAVLEDGDVLCWGQASAGQLGYGNTNIIGDNETPEAAGAVAIGGPAVAVTAGRQHTCALRDDNEVVCWGEGSWGALGYGTPADIGDNETPETAGVVEVY
ncbi:Regulator of chromosome condensation (RCC1) repeat protein [Enhygromyxa salina]|uniref:Regulator of chromosome condensation (RCC1) repeat protein n=2 Tax=Enhygromyxa salina TaxID=215803 RepID=A0A2S9YDG1_9BACT|nr:Regulator of chromosome condensation (RCC1) repeat protein [Enhygromyxa salina]